MKIAVVILAGGEGNRIGGAKPLRVLRGKRLIDRAEALARQWSDIIAVAVREPAAIYDLCSSRRNVFKCRSAPRVSPLASSRRDKLKCASAYFGSSASAFS